MKLERWLSVGDSFDTRHGHDFTVTREADANGYFQATDPLGAVGKFHTDAVIKVRRPVASDCPNDCPRCGISLRDAGYPHVHQAWTWNGAESECAFTWQPSAGPSSNGYSRSCMNDVAWVRTFAHGSPWSNPSGFRPNRERELVALGVLVPQGDGFVVSHASQAYALLEANGVTFGDRGRGMEVYG